MYVSNKWMIKDWYPPSILFRPIRWTYIEEHKAARIGVELQSGDVFIQVGLGVQTHVVIHWSCDVAWSESWNRYSPTPIFWIRTNRDEKRAQWNRKESSVTSILSEIIRFSISVQYLKLNRRTVESGRHQAGKRLIELKSVVQTGNIQSDIISAYSRRERGYHSPRRHFESLIKNLQFTWEAR